MSQHLRLWSCLLALASCASEADMLPPCSGSLYTTCLRLISPSLMHSAYDGVHEYSVTPWVPGAGDDTLDSDPIMASTVVWDLDTSFVAASEFFELPGAVKLTTKRAGITELKVTALTLSGARLRDRAQLHIAKGKIVDWEIGEARYRTGDRADWTSQLKPAAIGDGTCGLSESIEIPTTAACISCHDGRDSKFDEYTPTQTARYSDEELLNIVTTGAKPAGGEFISAFLRAMPMPDCIFAAFHTWKLNESEKQGIVLKLRSIAPHANP